MYKNYLKTAFRSLWRNRQFTLINIAGLALGITVFLFIMQFVAFEWSANRFNKNYKNLYRFNLQHEDGKADYFLVPGLAPLLKQQQPAIEDYTRIADGIAAGVLAVAGKNTAENKVFRETNIIYADGSFLKMFSFPIISGSRNMAAPQTMALSQKTSEKLFGHTNAVGKTILVSNQFGNTPYIVSSVYNIPESSDIKPEAVLSFSTLENAANRGGNDWADPKGLGSGYVNVYLQLNRQADVAAVSSKLNNYTRSLNYYPGAKTDRVYLQPFSELHLAPSFSYKFQTYGNLLLVTVFESVAVLILLIAWLNYINLSTAQALKRAKEVGVRKVLGASRLQLMLQHLSETILLTLTSILIAVFTVIILQQTFNQFTGQKLSLAVLNKGWFWLAGISMLTAGSVLSGGYVAFVLTASKPSGTLRGKAELQIKGFSMRKALVVFQFTASTVFIIATVILYRQLQFMKNEKLGMNLNQLLVIEGPTVTSDGQKAKNVSFKNALAQLSFVKKYTASNSVPGLGYNFSADGITRMNLAETDKKNAYSMFICDEKFFDTYGISFSQGSTYTAADAESSWNRVKKVIINEQAARQLGFNPTENLIGQKINWGSPYEIIGVVKDYHHLSLRDPIKPTLYLASVSFSYFTIQTDSRNLPAKIATIRNLFNTTFPGNPFDYFFADERYNQQYQTEQQLGEIFVAAASIAIFIACLGLFGLAAFSARQRIKEIGIRKVLGASTASITALLSKDFIGLVIISILTASPIAWLAMHKWLESFAYKAAISWWIFALSGCIAVLIALLTISFQSVKAALANPVKSLRSE